MVRKAIRKQLRAIGLLEFFDKYLGLMLILLAFVGVYLFVANFEPDTKSILCTQQGTEITCVEQLDEIEKVCNFKTVDECATEFQDEIECDNLLRVAELSDNQVLYECQNME